MKKQLFLQQLQQQAAKQSILNENRLLPKQLDFATAVVGNYPWQVLIIVSGLTATVLKLINK
jgi:hypothetical protein